MAKKREWKAWAVLMPNGKLAWHTTAKTKRTAKDLADPEDRVIRVRIVEDK